MLAEAHHFIVTRNQQRARPEPCERSGDADGGIADERGQPDGGGKPHDELDHAGEEGRTAVLHALDGGTVDGEQSEQKVKRCDNCKVDIGIMINFRCRVGEEHPHDRMAQQEDSGAHQKVEGLRLDQAGTHAHADALRFAGAEILGDVI